MQKLLFLAIAGVLGVFARYGLSLLVQRLNPGFFPWGTFVINMLGCFLFGLVWALAEERLFISGETRLIILTGFMGAFTTFSTYMFESSQLLRDGEWMLAAGNILGQNVVGIALMFAGLSLARFI
jgi:CrcB protein